MLLFTEPLPGHGLAPPRFQIVTIPNSGKRLSKAGHRQQGGTQDSCKRNIRPTSSQRESCCSKNQSLPPTLGKRKSQAFFFSSGQPPFSDFPGGAASGCPTSTWSAPRPSPPHTHKPAHPGLPAVAAANASFILKVQGGPSVAWCGAWEE